MSVPFTGVAVALVTVFDDALDVDVAATAGLAAQLVDLGIGAVVVAGTTGEAASLSADERVALVRAVKQAVPAAVPVIAGTGAASARQAVVLTAQARDAGADVALAMSPPSAADPRPYYETIADAVADLPLLAYHYPAVNPPGIPVDALRDLPVVGVKDSTGDAERLLAELDVMGDDRAVYPGSSAVVALGAMLGCHGAILALANAEPEDCVAAFGTGAPAGAAQRRLAAAHFEAKRRFPAGIKGLTAKRFGINPASRMG